MRIRETARFAALSVVVAGLVAGGVLLRGQGAAGGDVVVPQIRHDPAKELAMKITQPFTFAAVGDVIIRRAFADGEPGFQALTTVMREADMTYANMEGPIVDLATFSGPLYQDFRGPKTVADDLKRMGVRMVTTANNHTLDSGAEGMFETHRLLEAAGILHAGSGKNLAEARMARTAATRKGTVAAVGLYAIDAGSSPPRTRFYGATPSTPGLNPLHLNVFNVVTADQMQALKQIRDSVYARRSEVPLPVAPVSPNEPASRLQLFQTGFKVGARPGDLSYEIDQDDLKAIITSVRVGKQLADFLVVGIHCHQNSLAFQAYSHDNHTPDFLVEFAHQMIDNGADVFVGHGVHTLRGIEIYKGKPIFYGVSNFFYQDSPAVEVTNPSAPPGAGGATQQSANLESLLTASRFEGGKLVEVRLYPADLGQDRRPISKMGNPSAASPEMARRVLEKVRTLSKPFGTEIAVENGIGVIRLAQKAAN
jgi:poly-gamma-glutamate capsule biosynthesis protein CapA/YwtB (metallophosphatase superfamily)